MQRYYKFCYSVFSNTAKKYVKEHYEIEKDLKKANIKINPEVFISFTWFTGVLIGLIIEIILTILWLKFYPSPGDLRYYTLIPTLAVLGGLLTFLVFLSYPKNIARNRAKDIDAKLPYASNFISAMTTAGINPITIFEKVSKQKIYGEVSKEFELIYRDISLFGDDIITAIYNGIERSPSEKFQEFLQGIVSTILTGGHLKTYFFIKAEEYMKDNRMAQKSRLETLGIMAESFIIVVVAFPLFLVVLLSVMMMTSKQQQLIFLWMYLVALGIIPLAQIGFIIAIKTMED